MRIVFTVLQRAVIHGERSYVLAGCSPSGKCFLLGILCTKLEIHFFLCVVRCNLKSMLDDVV